MSLGVPLLAALVLHGLLLAAAGLRSAPAGPVPVPRADDTPELLVFSRLPPEPLPGDPVPLPPSELLPAPPPPRLPSRPRRPRAEPLTSSTRTRPRTASRTPARATAMASVPARANTPTRAKPPAPPAPAVPSDAAAGAVATMAPEQAERWRLLWLSAEAGASLPPPPAALAAALALAPTPAELRRLPLQRARQEAVEPASGQLLRLDGQRLLLWVEGPDLWLLRLPA